MLWRGTDPSLHGSGSAKRVDPIGAQKQARSEYGDLRALPCFGKMGPFWPLFRVLAPPVNGHDVVLDNTFGGSGSTLIACEQQFLPVIVGDDGEDQKRANNDGVDIGCEAEFGEAIL